LRASSSSMRSERVSATSSTAASCSLNSS
jgi:hypothetical protein